MLDLTKQQQNLIHAALIMVIAHCEVKSLPKLNSLNSGGQIDYDSLERIICEGYYVIIIFILHCTWEVANIRYALLTRHSLYGVVSMGHHKVSNFCISLKLLAYRQDFTHYFRFPASTTEFRYYEYDGLPLQ